MMKFGKNLENVNDFQENKESKKTENSKAASNEKKS